MTIQIDWQNEDHTIVLMEMIGHWTWVEAYEQSLVGYAMLETVDHTVNIIIDMRQSTGLPQLALTHARNMIAKRHPRTGLTVFVGVNTLFLTLWKVFSSAYRQFAHTQEFTFAATLEDAYALFAMQQPGTIKPI